MPFNASDSEARDSSVSKSRNADTSDAGSASDAAQGVEEAVTVTDTKPGTGNVLAEKGDTVSLYYQLGWITADNRLGGVVTAELHNSVRP